MKQDFGSCAVNEDSKKFLLNIIPDLHDIKASDTLEIMLPGINYVMHKATELAFNDAP